MIWTHYSIDSLVSTAVVAASLQLSLISLRDTGIYVYFCC